MGEGEGPGSGTGGKGEEGRAGKGRGGAQGPDRPWSGLGLRCLGCQGLDKAMVGSGGAYGAMERIRRRIGQTRLTFSGVSTLPCA